MHDQVAHPLKNPAKTLLFMVSWAETMSCDVLISPVPPTPCPKSRMHLQRYVVLGVRVTHR